MNNQLSWKIIKLFSSKNIYGFRTQDVVREFPEKHPAHLTKLLKKMLEEGMLCKLARDHYHIIPAKEDPETYIPDSNQVAKYIMQDKEYYIGYASAMRIHKLSFQSTLNLANGNLANGNLANGNLANDNLANDNLANGDKSKLNESKLKEYVVTKIQMKPALRIILGIPIQFVQQDTNRFFGFSSIWINQLEEAMVSDLEKTIVDIAAKPAHCGGIAEIANAIYQANDRKNHDKLFYYFARYKNKSAKKRFLFLTDLLGLEWTREHERMMKELGTGSSLLDPSAPNQGRNIKKFGLKINVDPNHIKKTVEV